MLDCCHAVHCATRQQRLLAHDARPANLPTILRLPVRVVCGPLTGQKGCDQHDCELPCRQKGSAGCECTSHTLPAPSRRPYA